MKKILVKSIIAATFALLLVCPVLSGQNRTEHERQKQRLEKEIEMLDAQLKKVSARTSDASWKLELLNRKVAGRKALVTDSERQIRRYDNEIRLKQLEINKLDARVDTLEFYFNKLVRSAYKNRDAKVWYMYLLASDNLSQAYCRLGYFKNMANQMKTESEKIAATKEELQQQRSQLQLLRKDADEVRAERRAELSRISADQDEARKVVSILKKDVQNYKRQLAQKRREVEALNREIERLVREAMKKAESEPEVKEETSGKTTPSKRTVVDFKLSGKFSSNKGKLPWPVEGPVVDKFGQHYDPVYPKLKLPFNNGISIAVNEGTEVIAVFDGVVKQIVVMPGYNQCVLVQHGSYFSFYCKLKNTAVKAGDRVKLGQVIGVVDKINSKSQLHFQIWKGTQPQNPESWLR